MPLKCSQLGMKFNSSWDEQLDIVFKEYKICPKKIDRGSIINSPSLNDRIDLNLLSMKLHTDSKLVLSDKVSNYIVKEYTCYIQVFTDGSVSLKGKVGIAISVPSLNINSSYRLNDNLSPYTCEGYAVFEALQLRLQNNIKLPLIISDSLALLQDISKNEISNTTLQDITSVIHHLIPQAKFLWLPSHIGLSDHDRVDGQAKYAATRQNIEKDVGWSQEDCRFVIERHIFQNWQDQ